MSLSTTKSLSEQLSILSSRQCFVDSEKTNPVRVVTVLPLSGSSSAAATSSSDVCETEVEEITDEVGICRLSRAELKGRYVARLICLTSNHSFRPLSITSSMLNAIMNEHDIGSYFLDIVSSFYQKVARIEEGLSMPFQVYESSESLEYMYIFRYPEPNSRGESWSIRQTALYHQIRRSDERSTFVLISPYRDTVAQSNLIDWLQSQTSITELKQNSHKVNELLLSTYLDNARYYTTVNEKRIAELWDKISLLGLPSDPSDSSDSSSASVSTPLHPSHLLQLKLHHSRLHPLRSSLRSTSRILSGLSGLSTLSFPPSSPDQKRFSQSLSNLSRKVSAYEENLDQVYRTCETATELLEGILEFDSGKNVLRLTEATTRDSRAMRVIAGITVGFLGMVVVAAIIAMPVFYLDGDSHRLEVSGSIWVYFAVSVPLTVGIVVYWRWSMGLGKAKRERESWRWRWGWRLGQNGKGKEEEMGEGKEWAV